ncbi:bolA-like protein 3 [Chironomus tepperi]|uniref:bolA-like protein 3 n=1 Tax=Chironomus tepperi TaxID=113505 RepID=UPI00391FC3FF
MNLSNFVSPILRQFLRSSIRTQSRLNFCSNGKVTEHSLTGILEKHFKGEVRVFDVSGGCGAMFEVNIKSPEFKGMSLVKQHQLVNKVLKEQVTQMHGIRIFTEAT